MVKLEHLAVEFAFGAGSAKQLYEVHDDLGKGLDWKENAYLGEVAA